MQSSDFNNEKKTNENWSKTEKENQFRRIHKFWSNSKE